MYSSVDVLTRHANLAFVNHQDSIVKCARFRQQIFRGRISRDAYHYRDINVRNVEDLDGKEYFGIVMR